MTIISDHNSYDFTQNLKLNNGEVENKIGKLDLLPSNIEPGKILQLPYNFLVLLELGALVLQLLQFGSYVFFYYLEGKIHVFF